MSRCAGVRLQFFGTEHVLSGVAHPEGLIPQVDSTEQEISQQQQYVTILCPNRSERGNRKIPSPSRSKNKDQINQAESEGSGNDSTTVHILL
jgi:hypothetical protein